MNKIIMIGCDSHDTNTVLKIADGPGVSMRKGFLTENRAAMMDWTSRVGPALPDTQRSLGVSNRANGVMRCITNWSGSWPLPPLVAANGLAVF